MIVEMIELLFRPGISHIGNCLNIPFFCSVNAVLKNILSVKLFLLSQFDVTFSKCSLYKTCAHDQYIGFTVF